MSALRSAITFLTRVPIGDGKKPDIDHAPNWFPVVGLILGAACGAVFAGGSWLAGPLTGAALAVGFGALITGAFHQDGLADTADAFGGGWTVEQRLEIFKDSRHGTYGVMSLVCVIAVQIAALSTLGPRAGFSALVAAHALGRVAAVVLMSSMKPARTSGLGARFAPGKQARFIVVFIIVGLGTASSWSRVWLAYPCILATSAAAALSMAWLSHRKIGGVVGDVFGATEQLVEASVLVTCAALAAHSRGWVL